MTLNEGGARCAGMTKREGRDMGMTRVWVMGVVGFVFFVLTIFCKKNCHSMA